MNAARSDADRDRGRLHERDDELRELLAGIASARDGRGRALVIEAAGGLGKTRLLDAVAGAARAARFEVLRATGSELERDLPFGAAVELLDRRVATAPATERADLLGGAARLAAPLLLGEAHGGGPPPEQMAVVQALSRVVVGLAGRRPLALVVDDLHWVDRPTVHLVAYLARRVAGSPVLLVAGTRPSEPGAPQDLLDPLLALPDLRVLRPGPLSATGTAAALGDLLGRRPSPAFTAACGQVTGGNPFGLREVVRALPDPQGTDTEVGRVLDIGPEPVARSVEATLRHLPPGAGRVARALSVLGDDAPAELTLALAGNGERLPGTLLDDLQRAGLLADTPGLRLVHPLVRQALLRSLPAGDRARLHARAAALHAVVGATDAAAAHLLHTPGAGQPWAVQALRAAADRARHRGAPAEAARLLQRAREEPPSGEVTASVLAEAARAQAAAGAPGARATFEAAIAAAGDDVVRAELLLALAWDHQTYGRFAEAVQAADRGLDLVAGEAHVAVELGAMRDAAALWSASDAPGSAGRMAAPKATGGQAGRVTLADEARRQMFAGEDHEGAAALARRAWEDGAMLRASTAEDPALIRVLTVFHNADRLSEALAVCDACVLDARSRGSFMAHATWRHLRGHVLSYAGPLGESEAELRVGFEARTAGWGAWLPVNASALATVLLERDEPDEALAVLDAAQASGRHPAASPMWANAEATRGRLLLAAGEPARAAEVLLAVGRRSRDELGTINPALSPWRADAVLALAAAGSVDEAREQAEGHLDEARRWGAPRALAAALRVSALVAPAGPRVGALAEAVRIAGLSEAQLEHAHALVALGEAKPGDEGLHALRRGLDAADRVGALALARRARAALSAAGARPRRARLAGAPALTVSERRVAQLAAEGRTTRQIAEELHVTSKAVSFHLGNVYRKLGVTGRHDLHGRV